MSDSVQIQTFLITGTGVFYESQVLILAHHTRKVTHDGLNANTMQGLLILDRPWYVPEYKNKFLRARGVDIAEIVVELWT